jgi:plasmid stability protein
MDMSVMIQIRNVPEETHRRLKARAALEGMSMSDYILRELRRLAEKPTLEELGARIAEQPTVELGESAAQAVRRIRDAR